MISHTYKMTPQLRSRHLFPPQRTKVFVCCVFFLLLRCCVPQQSQFQLAGNETQRQTEFLGVLAASQVDVSTLEEPMQALCQNSSIHWTRRVEGESGRTLYSREDCFDINPQLSFSRIVYVCQPSQVAVNIHVCPKFPHFIILSR